MFEGKKFGLNRIKINKVSAILPAIENFVNSYDGAFFEKIAKFC